MASQEEHKIASVEQDTECQILNEEYETQFFGFAPTDVYEGINGLVTDRFEYTISKLEQNMKKIPQDVLSEAELTEGIARLRSITHENMTTLSKLQKHLQQNIFKIPSSLLLPEDVEQMVAVSDENKKVLMNEIEDLKMQLKTEKYMEAALAEELKDQEEVLQSQENLFRDVLSPAVMNTLEEDTEKLAFLKTNVEPLLKRLHALREGTSDPAKVDRRFQEDFENLALE